MEGGGIGTCDKGSTKAGVEAGETDVSDTDRVSGGKLAPTAWQEDASRQQEIDANVRARSEQHRAEATLESKDGCAGENYECTFIISVYHVHLWLGLFFPIQLRFLS